ncbi:MAG: CBS domain-containing protein [Gemmatimonadetes bacterium]|nr:CBS domain-containing protein [Gemmatimonadota bacterium]
MIVSMWMSRDVLTIEQSMPVGQAAVLMKSRNIRNLPVLAIRDGTPKVVGLLSLTELLRALPAGSDPLTPDIRSAVLTAGDVMRHDPITTTPESPIEEAATAMRHEKIGALPVVRDGTLVGIITESDIFHAFANILETASGDARVTFDVTVGEDIFVWLADATRRRGVRVNSFIVTEQGDRPVCVARFSGGRMEMFLDDLWKSGHKVLNVLRVE